MKLPHPRTTNLAFLADSPTELIQLLGKDCGINEDELIHNYFDLSLPPVTSINALSVMFGYNPGFVWSMIHNTNRHYRTFTIPKGREKRYITAPKVALKTIQKWLAVHISQKWESPDDVFGFVPGKSHIQAASRHLGAKWIVSADIENFFPSVSRKRVGQALLQLGYQDEFSLNEFTSLFCYGIGLAQGAPSSPVISNIVLSTLDKNLSDLATTNGCTFTRYADDIVFSGSDGSPENLLEELCTLITEDGWTISNSKKYLARLPNRLKVHGLLVHGDRLRLTKGYRNRLRAYRHLLSVKKVQESDIALFRGHLEYERSVEQFQFQ